MDKTENVHFTNNATSSLCNSETIAVQKLLMHAHEKLLLQQDKLQLNLDAIEVCQNSALIKLQMISQDVRELFDKTEHAIRRIKLKDLKKIAELSERCGDISAALTNIEQKQMSRPTSQLPLTTKAALEHVRHLQRELTNISAQNNVRKYTLEPCRQITELVTYVTSPVKMLYIKPRMATFDKDLDSVTHTNEHGCVVRDMAFLSNESLCTLDSNNKCAKLIDVAKNMVTSKITFVSPPWNITKVNNQMVAVTLPRESKIVFVSVALHCLKIINQIKLNEACYGITCNGDKLIVSVNPNGKSYYKLRITDFSGTTLRTISKKFDSPCYLTCSLDRKTMYVAYDKAANTGVVLSMNFKGIVKAKFVAPNIGSLSGLAIDRGGSVYVCASHSNKILYIQPDLTTARVLFNCSNGLSNPKCIAYSDSLSKLYIGMNDCVKMFVIL